MSIDGFDLTGRDVADAVTGKTGAAASEKAAELQYQSSQDAIHSQEKFLRQTRRDLNPFRQAGAGQLDGLNALISDPNAQLNFIQNNPFFSAIAKDAQNRLMSSQAARGRLGTGDTPAALQNQLLLLGTDLLNNSIGQRMNLATMGQNAASMTGTATQNTGNSIADLMTGAGNALASGAVGAGNSMSQGGANALSALGIFLSDRRFKTGLKQRGEIHGIPIYSFRYVGGTQEMVGVMAQDVEPVAPGAVLDVFGVKYVDYDELNRVLH